MHAVCAALEGAEAAHAFASGMAAIAAALHVTLRPGDTLLAASQLYGNTYSLIERHIRPLGVEVVYADVSDPGQWERPARVRYAETIANPGFPLADLAALAGTKGDALLIVDNTFASPVLCRPVELGADVVVHSATKYLNGHHDVTVISHPASTSHRQFTADQLRAAGVSEGLLRLAVGCEDADDVIADLDAALAHA